MAEEEEEAEAAEAGESVAAERGGISGVDKEACRPRSDPAPPPLLGVLLPPVRGSVGTRLSDESLRVLPTPPPPPLAGGLGVLGGFEEESGVPTAPPPPATVLRLEKLVERASS